MNGSLAFDTDGQVISSPNDDNDYTVFHARDNGVGLVEVARLSGAAEPFWSFGASQQHKFQNNGYIGFFAATPVTQQAHIDNPTDEASLITAVTAILTALENFGFLATS